MKKHSILFLAANPSETDRLALGREAQAIQAELERTRWRDRFELATWWAAEPLDLLRALRRLAPTVVHFSGHGAQSASGAAHAGLRTSGDIVAGTSDMDASERPGLVFQGLDGRPRIVPAIALREAFGAAGASVRLVLLNACYSEPVAEVLLACVDCVVGMPGSIGDDAARSFAIGLYGALGECASIDDAYRSGCAAIHLDGHPETHRPRLKVRGDIDTSRLVLADSLAAATTASIPVLQLTGPMESRASATQPRPAGAPVAPLLGRPPTSIAMSAEVLDRLARMKREVAAILKARPRALEQLAARVGCDPAPEALADRLVELRGREAAAHVLAVSDDQPATLDGDADRAALHAVLFVVLPYVSEWRDEVAACCRQGEGHAGAVELRYRSDTIAEAVMAGWVGRRCFFECKAGSEPYGVGAVQIPATAQTALFNSEQHLLEGVVKQLMYQLGVGGLNPDEQRLRVLAALRNRAARKGAERMRYYFLFRDAASPEDPVLLWRVARKTLHGESGLPGLVLVRMQGELSADEAELEESISELLKPRRPS